jgi:hypothetical protein
MMLFSVVRTNAYGAKTVASPQNAKAAPKDGPCDLGADRTA